MMFVKALPVESNVRKATTTELASAPTVGVLKKVPKDVPTFPKEYQFLADQKILNKTCFNIRIIASTYLYTQEQQTTKNQTFSYMDVYTDFSFWEYPGGWPRDKALIAIDRCLKQLLGTSKFLKSDMKSIRNHVMAMNHTGNLCKFMQDVVVLQSRPTPTPTFHDSPAVPAPYPYPYPWHPLYLCP